MNTTSKDTTMSAPSMRVVQIHRYGGPEELKLEERPRPEPQAGEALVQVHAAGVNPIDWKIRQGVMHVFQPVTFPFTPGIELAGVVAAVGPEVRSFALGQAVYAQVAAGAYAEFLAVGVEALAPKPERLTFVEAAATPVGARTAWRTLFDHGHLAAGQRVLIQGAAGGVGQFAVQLAKWRGAEVIGTAAPENLEFVRSLGADRVVDYTTSQVESVVNGLDLALDTVGEATLRSSMAVLRPGGALISLNAVPSQQEAQALGVRALMSRGPASVSLETLTQLIEEGHLRVTVGMTFALRDVQQAHEAGQRGHGRGKIVLRILNEQNERGVA
jgi:NADPH:quinone reductase-like Zn-dependent oxidoreductase